MPKPIGLTPETAKALTDLLSATETARTRPTRATAARYTTFVEITAEEDSGGFGRCVPMSFIPTEDAWRPFGECKVFDVNGGELPPLGQRALALHYGYDDAGQSVFGVGESVLGSCDDSDSDSDSSDDEGLATVIGIYPATCGIEYDVVYRRERFDCFGNYLGAVDSEPVTYFVPIISCCGSDDEPSSSSSSSSSTSSSSSPSSSTTPSSSSSPSPSSSSSSTAPSSSSSSIRPSSSSSGVGMSSGSSTHSSTVGTPSSSSSGGFGTPSSSTVWVPSSPGPEESSVPGGGECGGTCEWTWATSYWQLSGGECTAGCQCSYPDGMIGPYDGYVMSTGCVPGVGMTGGSTVWNGNND